MTFGGAAAEGAACGHGILSALWADSGGGQRGSGGDGVAGGGVEVYDDHTIDDCGGDGVVGGAAVGRDTSRAKQ